MSIQSLPEPTFTMLPWSLEICQTVLSFFGKSSCLTEAGTGSSMQSAWPAAAIWHARLAPLDSIEYSQKMVSNRSLLHIMLFRTVFLHWPCVCVVFLVVPFFVPFIPAGQPVLRPFKNTHAVIPCLHVPCMVLYTTMTWNLVPDRNVPFFSRKLFGFPNRFLSVLPISVRIDNPVCVQKGISGWSHAIPQSRTSRFVAVL